MKRKLATILCFVLMLSMLPTISYAENAQYPKVWEKNCNSNFGFTMGSGEWITISKDSIFLLDMETGYDSTCQHPVDVDIKLIGLKSKNGGKTAEAYKVKSWTCRSDEDFSYILNANEIPSDFFALSYLKIEASSMIKYNVKFAEYEGYSTSATIPRSINMTVGEKKAIELSNATSSSKLAYVTSWYSSDETFAVVNSKGIVTAKKEGTCIVTANLAGGLSLCSNIIITNGGLEHSNITIYRGTSIVNSIIGASTDVTWKSSNKKIATVSSNGKIKGIKLGKCTVSAFFNGAIYKCNVQVIQHPPKYGGYLADYYTRSKCFEVKIHNYGKKNITILSSGANAKDKDYKHWDRKVKLSKGSSITIKPGKTKFVRFKVSGKQAWPNYLDATIFCYIKVDGKKYYTKFIPWDYEEAEEPDEGIRCEKDDIGATPVYSDIEMYDNCYYKSGKKWKHPSIKDCLISYYYTTLNL